MIAPSYRLPAALLLSIILLSGFFFTDIKAVGTGLLTRPTHKDSQSEQLAYITFFTGTEANKSDPDISKDVYFTATRILGYQLMHQPETRTQRNIPFVVLVPPDVVPAKRDRFQKDGATVIEVPYMPLPEWVIPEQPRWKDVMSKMRAWQQTQYSRCLLLDGDMILNSPLDGVFDDPATQFIPTKAPSTPDDEEDNLPSRYLFASTPEATAHHVHNGEFSNINYFNAGFFVFGPSIPVFDYYTTKLHEQGTWDPKYPEQNLLNYIHSHDGRMPWQHVELKWNIKFPHVQDKAEGVASMHDKYWHADVDAGLQDYYHSIRWRMEGFYEGLDARVKGSRK